MNNLAIKDDFATDIGSLKCVILLIRKASGIAGNWDLLLEKIEL